MSKNPSKNPSLILCAAACLAIVGGAAVVPARADTPTEPPNGITLPSVEAKLTFAVPGIIADVLVKDGDAVKAGQPLIQEDDVIEKFTLDSMKLEAASTARIDYSASDMAIKKVVLVRKREMYNETVASKSELEEAELGVQEADAQSKLSQLEHAQKGLDADKQQKKVNDMQLLSPVDGFVQKVNVSKGEAVDPAAREPEIIVVKNDPLWVEIRPNTAQSTKLKLGDMLEVRYGDEQEAAMAKVIFMAPEADAASDTQLVRLELPNPNNKPSGLHVYVKLPDKVQAAQANQ